MLAENNVDEICLVPFVMVLAQIEKAYIENKIDCKTRKFTFSMTTNALLLHKYIWIILLFINLIY